MSKTEIAGFGTWGVRVAWVLACVAAVVLLVVDSPWVDRERHWNHAVFEAAPLMLVGVVFLVWLGMERPAAAEWIKQGCLGLAFVGWGIDLLMPAGAWATFLGAVVIAIYVFDLAWMIEGKIRQKNSRSG